MKFSQLVCLFLLASLLIFTGAHAETGLSAAWEGDALVARWTDCRPGSAELTVYLDGWPVLVTRVDCAAGQYAVPAGYTAAAGRYAVRLRTDSGCVRVDAAARSGDKTPSARPATPPPAASESPVATEQHEPTLRPTVAPTPSSRPAATPTPVPLPAGSADTSLAGQVVAQVNQERAALGLSALRVDADLTAAACLRAREIAVKFSHTRPDGSGWSTVSGKAYAENIAMGQNSADKVMAAWMSSPGHRENILRPTLGSIGVCALRVNGVLYWAQLFGK